MTRLKSQTTAKKTQSKKPVTASAKQPIKKKIEVENISPVEKILGKKPAVVETEIIDYESPKARYRVTNLAVNNAPIIVRGDVIESFIGAKNSEARENLINGAKKVVTYDIMGNSQFKIEVI